MPLEQLNLDFEEKEKKAKKNLQKTKESLPKDTPEAKLSALIRAKKRQGIRLGPRARLYDLERSAGDRKDDNPRYGH